MQFLEQNYFMTLKHIYPSAWFVNEYILTFASHKQLHMYGFSDMVNLLDSAPGTALQVMIPVAMSLLTCSGWLLK